MQIKSQEAAEEDPSCSLVHRSHSHSQFASFCLWLLASVHEREIYIDLSGCLHCSGQKVDRRCFTKEIKEPKQATRRTGEHNNTEVERHTGCTQLNKYDCCIDNVSECHYHFDRPRNSFPSSAVLEYQTGCDGSPQNHSYVSPYLLCPVGLNRPFKAL